MQVMGQVAREHGFEGKFLSALCDPALGLDIGCAALAAKWVEARAFRPAKSAGSVEGFSPGASLPQTVAKTEEPGEPGQGTALSEIAHALELWNGGSNPNYAAQVLARLPHYK